MKLTLAARAVLAAVVLLGTPAMAGSVITGMGASLAASPATDVGRPCPRTIAFYGSVVVGAGHWERGHPAEVAVQFQRSDGGIAPITYFNVAHQGKHAVSATWTLGGATLPTYSGWERIKAWPTAGGGVGDTFSNKATFHMACGARR